MNESLSVPQEPGQDNTTKFLLILLLLLGSSVVIKFSQSLLAPILIAAFFTMLIQPVMRWLNRKLPNWLSLCIVLLALGVMSLAVEVLFFTQLGLFKAKATFYLNRFQHMSQWMIDFAKQYGVQLTWEQIGTKQAMKWVFSFLSSSLSSLFSLVGYFALIAFLAIFMMLESGPLQKKLTHTLRAQSSDIILDTFHSIALQIQHYMFTKTMLSLLTGFCMALTAYLLGIDFALLWGILAFLLNYIPNVGSIIAVIPPTLIGLVQFDSPVRGLIALALFAAIQTIIGNVIEPRTMGNSLNLSTLVIFLSMVFWGWMWGVTGMILSVPLTVCIKIICEHVDGLRPLAILLGAEVPQD